MSKYKVKFKFMSINRTHDWNSAYDLYYFYFIYVLFSLNVLLMLCFHLIISYHIAGVFSNWIITLIIIHKLLYLFNIASISMIIIAIIIIIINIGFCQNYHDCRLSVKGYFYDYISYLMQRELFITATEQKIQINRQTERSTNKQIDRQTDTHTYIHTICDFVSMLTVFIRNTINH